MSLRKSMTREQLEHAIRAACDVSKDSELWIFGSQAILGQFPHAPESLRTSIEVDVQPKNQPDAVDFIDGALGELSMFHQTHGFYVHGVSINSAVLPQGWEDRAIPISDQVLTKGNTGWCVEAHDLTVSKLAAYREKDKNFARTLLVENMIETQILLDRIYITKIDDQQKGNLLNWVKITAEDLYKT